MEKQNLQKQNIKGIALVAVLSILVVLAIIASVFTINMSVENKMGKVQIAKLQADLIADSALEHAMCLIREDAFEQPAWDDKTEEMFTAFSPETDNPNNNVNVDGISENGNGKDARWIYVKNKEGDVIGRYAVLIEDEAAKININMARALNSKMQDEGIGTFEIMLTDGKDAGLPVSLSFAKRIIKYRYGRDMKPGQANVDDNLTASSYASDQIDNDADGLIDEANEGIDEPEEYNPVNPKWDDRSFSSIKEACIVVPKQGPLDITASRYLSKYGTVNSKSRNLFYDEVNKTQSKKININIASKRQISSLLRRANEDSRFESKSKNMRTLVGNITDYRDENSVLSTMGSEYGVEAVCFNEVMANDGSYTLRFDRNDEYWEGDNRVLRFGWFYERPDKNYNKSYGWEIKSVSAQIKTSNTVLTNGVETRFRHAAWVKLADDPIKKPQGYSKFKSLMKKEGGWKKDIWKNSWLVVVVGDKSGGGYTTKYTAYPILGNTSDKLEVGVDDRSKPEFPYNYLAAIPVSNELINCTFINNLWRDNNGGLTCVFPEMKDDFFFPVFSDSNLKRPPKSLYYKMYVGENNLGGDILESRYNSSYIVLPGDHKISTSATPWKGFNEMLDLDGIPSEYSETKMLEITSKDLEGSTLRLPDNQTKVWLLRTPYQEGEPIRAKNGWINVNIATCKQTGYVGGIGKTSDLKAYQNKNVAVSAYMMRPDIVEMINISDHPVSLRNWRIVINTGSYADQVGLIDEATLYSKWRQGLYDDPNPTIQPGGYFYITNNRKIFDREYGAPKDGSWGGSISESYPCVDIPDTLWGVRYKVESIKRGSGNRGDTIVCEGARWRKDQMKYEMSEWYLRKPRKDQNSSMGVRLTVKGNTRNGLYMGQVRVSSLKVGDDILLLGMPREGGFLSMTLKNQYNQITARTVTYGSTKLNEINYSTEKIDPTHYNWIKSRKPSFGGTERKARNHAQPRGNIIKPHVKDNCFASVGEIQKVRKAEDWENIGMQKKGHPNTRTLKAIAKYFTTSGIRLDPEQEGAHISGWKPAFGKAKFSSAKKITADGVKWQPGIWDHQFLRILSGKQKGEKYVIKSNTDNGITVIGYSLPSGKQLRVNSGDKFSVGAGYSTPMYYTRQNGDEGIWEWKNKGLSRSNYGLYLSGLNDSIDTTEFLEENHNAQLEVSVFNYETHEFDHLPIVTDKTLKRSKDAYKNITSQKNHQYEKSDAVYCGMIHPEHISSDGGIKIKIIARGLGSVKNSGFAWFDYAYLSPGEEMGKININTASERVLRALNGISPELAHNIFAGISNGGKSDLKPYKNVTDVLDVKGMTPDIFSKNVNLITIRSDQFRVIIVAQTIKNTAADGKTGKNEEVIAETRREIIIDRSELTDDDPKTTHFVRSFGN